MMAFLQAASFVLVFVFAALLIYAAVNDYRHYVIANKTVLAVLGLFLPFIASQFALPAEARLIAAPGAHLIQGGLCAILVFAGAAALFAVRAMGGGDVKLLAVITLWAGPGLTLPFLLTTALAGGVVTLAVLVHARTRVDVTAAEASGGASQIVNPLQPKLNPLKVPYGLGICAGGLMVAYALLSRAMIVA